MGNIHTVGPNEVLVISGGCFGTQQVQSIVGGYGWTWWFVSQAQRLSLEVITLKPRCEHVETSEGVPLTVTGVAQVKFMKDDEFLTSACEQFLGKSRADIEDTLLQTLEGHLRSILGTLTVEEVYKDRDQFAQLVRDVASPDVGRMGVEVLSFTIKDVYDDVEYLDSLGRAQTAIVKRDADIGVAVAEKDAGIMEAECEKLRMDAHYQANALVASSQRDFEKQQAAFSAEVNTAKAQAELAYNLQVAKEQQNIRSEEIQINIVERRKQIELEDQEILCNEKKLDAQIRQPAEAEAFRLQQTAEANRFKTVCGAQADAESIRLSGIAEAEVIERKGLAEAERMRLRAEAYTRYGDVAMLSLVLETMPKIAAEVSAPLAKMQEIVRISGTSGQGLDASVIAKLGQDFSSLVGNVPPAVRALSGVDLTNALAQLPGATKVK